jgi:hypothetical protein
MDSPSIVETAVRSRTVTSLYAARISAEARIQICAGDRGD